jgi:serine/threonine-protein kinase
LEARTKTEWTRVQERVARLMATVAHAIHYAHQHGVIHRDIKPGNILIDAEGQPHLSDFGLAMLTDAVHRVSQTGAVIGTLSYLAPEQATGATASVATDIYGLGAVLFELLTGSVPFGAATPVEVLRTVTERPPQRPSAVHKDINRDLETICLKCLEKNPSNRYGSARALAEDLERWQRHEPILARPIGTIVRLGRWVRRYPVGAALIASLFVGLVVSLTFLRFVIARNRDAEKANRACRTAGAVKIRTHARGNFSSDWREQILGKPRFDDPDFLRVPGPGDRY